MVVQSPDMVGEAASCPEPRHGKEAAPVQGWCENHGEGGDLLPRLLWVWLKRVHCMSG